MAPEKNYAVITGDVVHSSLLNAPDRIRLLQVLKGLFSEIETFLGEDKVRFPFEIFRGDSFQLTLSDLKSAFDVMVLIRTGLKKEFILPVKSSIDAKIAIGIGTIDDISSSASGENDGEAYRFSGNELDNLNKGHRRLSIVTSNSTLNDELAAYCVLLDQIFLKISSKQAETIFWYTIGKTQFEIAQLLNIRQSSVNDRLNSGGIIAFNALKERLDFNFNSL